MGRDTLTVLMEISYFPTDNYVLHMFPANISSNGYK